MKLKALFTDDTAVSPVIGVILMVAITVILAAVIGTFVLGLGEQTAATPQASFSFDYNGTALTITHESGTAIDATLVNVSSTIVLDSTEGGSQLAGASGKSESWNSLSGVDEISAGEQVTVHEHSGASPTELDGATVRLVWTDEGGSTSATLQKWTGPDA